jgi:microcystin-dependent protein
MNHYIGEIITVAFNVAPRGWACCDGQTLPVNQNMALFSLLGIRYGGDGSENFSLPDLRGRVPMGAGRPGDVIDIGDKIGAEHIDVTLHQLEAKSLKVAPSREVGKTDMPVWEPMEKAGKPVTLMQPYIVVNYIIALTGLYPSRN